MKRSTSVLVAIGTAILNWFVFVQIGYWLKLHDPQFFATALLLALVVHEVGHWIALEANGVKTHLVFLVIMGGAVPDMHDKDKLDQMPWSNKAAVYLAGITGNILVVVVYGILTSAGSVTWTQFEGVVNISGALILYNLLPFWIFDGGHFAKVLFNSIAKERDINFVLGIGTVVIGFIMIMAIFFTQAFYATGLLIFWGLQFQAKHDDPHGSWNKLAMTVTEQRNWAGYYIFLLALGITFLSTTRPWLQIL